MTIINFGYKVNIINFIYATRLNFQMQKSDNNIPKINSFFPETYNMIVAIFWVFDLLDYSQFF